MAKPFGLLPFFGELEERPLSPIKPPLLRERDEVDIARTEATLARLSSARERLRAAIDDDIGSVSPDFRKSASDRLSDLESFADRLVRENVKKQAEPDRVERNIRRTTRLLNEHWARVFPEARNIPYGGRIRPKRNFTSNDFRPVMSRKETVPRTVFGTEAIVNRMVHAMHLNGGFLTRAITIPCIQRDARRQVMFAKSKAGRGYRGRRRRSKFGDIWC